MEIIARNTAILIKDYEWGKEGSTIERFFRVYEPVSRTSYTLGIYYDEEDRTLYVPGCYPMFWIYRETGLHSYIREDAHPYLPLNKKAMFKHQPKNANQVTAINFLISGGDYTENQYLSQLALNLSTGIGKSYVSIMAITYLGVKAIIITGSSSLLNQWEKEFDKFTNLNGPDILRITGSDMINYIITGKSNAAKRASVYLVTHKTLESYGSQFGYKNIGRLFEVLGIGIKVYDEYHQQFRSMLMIDFFTNTWKSFYLSATAARSSKQENTIFKHTYGNIKYLDLFDPEVDPHTNYVAIKFNSKPSPLDIQKCKNKYNLDISTYCNYVTKKKEFYMMMHIVMQMVMNSTGPCLMYLHTNDAVLRVYKWIAVTYPRYLGEIGIFTSLVDKNEKVKEKNKALIITTLKSCAAGEHIEHLQYTFVLADPFKSEVLARQSLGRTRDRDTTYVELVDLGFRQINKFYRDKLPVFNKYALSTSDILVDQYELKRRYENIVRQRVPWKHEPIELFDERFNFPDDLKVPEKIETDPNCPLIFWDEEPLENWVPLY